MKHLILLAALCATALITTDISGQAGDPVPEVVTMQSHLDNFKQDDKRKYYMQEVVHVEGHSKEQLYGALKLWTFEHFEDENFVFEADDQEAGLLVGRGWAYLGVTTDWSTVKMYYSVKIMVRDGKYRFRIYHVEFDDHTSDDTVSGMTTLTDKVNAARDENGHTQPGVQYTFASSALEYLVTSNESLMNLDIDELLSMK